MIVVRNTRKTLFSWGEIWSESFGNPSDPFVLMVMAASRQGIYWNTSFCEALARQGFYVVRFDHRDTGLSTHINFNANPYRYIDMVDDLRGLIYDYGQTSVHILGSGMGGHIAQLLAIESPQFVRSMVIINSTWNVTPILAQRVNYILPSSDPDVYDALMRRGTILLNDPNYFQSKLDMLRILNGKDVLFDEEEWGALIIEERARTNRMHSPTFFHHHILAGVLSNSCFESEKISQPALIIHGASNPFVLVEHAYATHQKIPMSALLVIEEMGHLHGKSYNKILSEPIVSHWQQCHN